MSHTPKYKTYATDYHVPIMVDEVLELLAVKPGGVYVDGTLGGGGHTHAILDASGPDGRVIAIDRDPEARAYATERLADYGDRLTVVAGNYGDVEAILEELDEEPVDGLLVDAGISSHQVDEADRGFSFSKEGPLDMRMSDHGPTLAEWLDSVEERDLTYILKKFGEVKPAKRLARAILEDRKKGLIETTTDLARVCESINSQPGRPKKIHPATLVFQALRIAINDELDGLQAVVDAVPNVVKSGGRAAFISFHSLEDRIVKQSLREMSTSDIPHGVPVTEDQLHGDIDVLTRKPVMASDEEIEFNPRARSAKLRAAQVR